jgi:hypothetical protein
MSNVLDDTTQQQILALGRLGWSLRRIEQALALRRETISGYLKAAAIAARPRPAERINAKTGHCGQRRCPPPLEQNRPFPGKGCPRTLSLREPCGAP